MDPASAGPAEIRASPGPAEIRTLTGLRGVLATLVMLDHYAAIDFTAPFPADMLPHMYLAVDMFMLLSGFILAMTYEDRLSRLSPGAFYRLFIGRRVARLYPLYALTTILCFGLCRAGLLTFLNPDTSGAALGANLLAIQSWSWPGSSLNGPGWSISTEWLANLLFPLLAPLLLGRSPVRAAAACALAFALVVGAAVAFGQLFDVPAPGAVNSICGPGAVGRCVGEFAVGIYCWRLRSGSPGARWLGGNGVQLALLALLFLLMQDTALDTLSVAVCAVMLVGLSFDSSVVSAALQAPAAMFLGRISYSIYLLHVPLMPVRDGLAAMLRAAGVPGAWWVAVPCCALLVVVLATITWRFLEQPAQAAVVSSLHVRGSRSAC